MTFVRSHFWDLISSLIIPHEQWLLHIEFFHSTNVYYSTLSEGQNLCNGGGRKHYGLFPHEFYSLGGRRTVSNYLLYKIQIINCEYSVYEAEHGSVNIYKDSSVIQISWRASPWTWLEEMWMLTIKQGRKRRGGEESKWDNMYSKIQIMRLAWCSVGNQSMKTTDDK